jgi:hypothetical protein
MADDTNDLNINIGMNPSGVESGSRRSKAAIESVTGESKQLEQAFRRIKSAIDPTFAAQEKYNRLLADAKLLLDSGKISKKEYTAAINMAKTALDQETAALERNSAAGRAAAAEAKAAKQAETIAAKQASQAQVQAAREKVAAERLAAKEAAAAAKQKAAEEKIAIKEAATAAKLAAKEKADAERASAQEAKAAAKEAAAAEAAAKKEATEQEKAAIAERLAQEKAARAAEKAAARDAATAAAAAAKEKAAADKLAAQAAREAATAAEAQAKAEKADAQAAVELRASIDPAYASQLRFNNTMATATKLLNQQKITEQEFIAIQKQAKAQMDVNNRSLGRTNMVSVQLGYQMQDVAASIASGIRPMVILAQQGGQTASALAMMGGTVGKVGSLLGGFWVQAILAAIMVMDMLWSTTDKGKQKTLDLNDAESRRAATVKDLTEALKQYVDQQRQSNSENLIALNRTNDLNVRDRDRLKKNLDDARAARDEAKREFDLQSSTPSSDPTVHSAVIGSAARLASAEAALTKATNSYNTSTQAVTESTVAYAKALSAATHEDVVHQNSINAITNAYKLSGKTAADLQTMVTALRKENERDTAAKNAEAEARRENAAAIKAEAREIFHSRQQAIQLAGHELQKQGYGVGENAAFGGIHGNHPGMGNTAHAQFAIDVNIPGIGNESQDAAAKKQMDKMVAAYQARGFRILWNGKVYQPNGNGPSYDIPPNVNQHRDHVHIEAPQSLVGKPAGKELANQLIADDKAIESEEHKHAREAVEAQAESLEGKKELYRDDLYAQLQLQDEIEAIKTAFYGKDSKQAEAAHRETLKLEEDIAQKEVAIAQATINKKLQIDDQYAQARKAEIDAQRGGEGDVVDFKAQNGLISERQALAEKKNILAEEYQDNVTYEEKIYTLKATAVRQQLELENLTKDARRQLLDQLEVMEAEHQAKMVGLKASYGRQSQQIDIQTAQISMSTWRDMFQAVGQSLNSTFQGLWTHSMTVWQGLINLGDQIVYKFAEMGERVLVDWLTKQAVKMTLVRGMEATQTAIHVAGEGARTAATASGAAARAGIEHAGFFSRLIAWILGLVGIHIGGEVTKTGATAAGTAARVAANKVEAAQEVASAIGIAGANGVASWALAPWPIDAGAPAFGASMAAAAAGLGAVAAAEGGDANVREGLYHLHDREMVLPAWAAEPMRANLRASGRTGVFNNAATAGDTIRSAMNNTRSDANFYYQPRTTLQSVSMSELLRRDGRELRRWLYNEHRNGNLRLDRP